MSPAEYWIIKEQRIYKYPYGLIIEFAHREFININVYSEEKDCVFFSQTSKQWTGAREMILSHRSNESPIKVGRWSWLC